MASCQPTSLLPGQGVRISVKCNMTREMSREKFFTSREMYPTFISRNVKNISRLKKYCLPFILNNLLSNSDLWMKTLEYSGVIESYHQYESFHIAINLSSLFTISESDINPYRRNILIWNFLNNKNGLERKKLRRLAVESVKP